MKKRKKRKIFCEYRVLQSSKSIFNVLLLMCFGRRIIVTNRMKRRIALLQAVVLLTLPIYANIEIEAANEYPIVYSESVQGGQGEEITVPIKLSGNKGVMGFKINIAYDKQYLTPLRVKAGSCLAGVFDHNMDVKETSDFDVMWSGSEEMKEDGVLFEVVFRISDYVRNGSTEIGITYSQEDTFNESYQDVVLDCSSVDITIEGESKATEIPSTGSLDIVSKEAYKLSADKIEAKAGESVSIPVKLQGNLGIIGFLMYVEYDTDVLEPVSVIKGDIIPVGTTFDDNCTTAEGNSYKILWSGIDEMHTDGNIFTLNFLVKEKAETADSFVTLSYKQTDTFDAEYQDVKLQCEPIEIHITEKPPEKTEAPGTPSPSPGTEEPAKPTETPGHSGTEVVEPNGGGSSNVSGQINEKKQRTSSVKNVILHQVKKPGKVTGVRVKRKKKKLLVSWKRKLNVDGFQIQYALNKKFTKKKKSKFAGKSISKKYLSKLKKGKTYYVRVRAYRKLTNGGKKYGKWSKVKKCKVK